MWHCVTGWVSVIDWKDRGVFVFTAWPLCMKALIYFETLESTHLTTRHHNPIGPSLNYTAAETSDLPYLVAFKPLLIADSPLFYPWPTVYKCCVLLPPLCFIRDHLSTTAEYCWLRTVLSVTVCVQLLRIAVCALFYPWLFVYNCCLSLTPHYFIFDHLYATVAYCSLRFVFPWPSMYNCCFSQTLHCFTRDHLCTTTAYRWLRTISSLIICIRLLLFADSVQFYPWQFLCTCRLNPCAVATFVVVDFSNQFKLYPILCRYVMDLSNVT